MREISYNDTPYTVREDLTAAHRRAWQRLAEPGTWFSGADRVAIMAESRHAMSCELCQQRKAALSPHTVEGVHDSLGHEHLEHLSETMIEIIHRIRTDPGRLTKAWYDGVCADNGIGDTHYVEIVGVVASTVAIDTFARGIGSALLPLPEPVAGEPTRYRPPSARLDKSWVPTIPPDEATGTDAELYAGRPVVAHIYQAMSLVPAEVKGFFDIVNAQYLAAHEMRDFEHEFRAINHAQIELVAGRVSALNQCVY